MKVKTDSKPAKQSRRTMIAMTGLAAAGAAIGLSKAEAAAKPKPMLMFVQLSEGIKVDEAAKTIRLVNLNPSTLYFADRPERIAGHVKLANYLQEWTSKAGNAEPASTRASIPSTLSRSGASWRGHSKHTLPPACSTSLA